MKLGNRLLWMSLNLRAPGFKPPEFDRFVLHLPLRTSDRAATGQSSEMWRKLADHPAYDSFWQSISVRGQIRRRARSVALFRRLVRQFRPERSRSLQRAQRRVGRASPGGHRSLAAQHVDHVSRCGFRSAFGSSRPDHAARLDGYWLKGRESALLAAPPVRIFVMGGQPVARRARVAACARAADAILSHCEKAANSLDGSGELSKTEPRKETPDQFVFDPRNPVPTRGGGVCCTPAVFPWGPMDQRPVERRPDVARLYIGPSEEGL